MNIPILSKSKIMNGLQCQRLLWLKTHHPELAEKKSAATQMQLEEGNLVGQMARKHFGEGILIEGDHWDYSGLALTTKQAIEKKTPILFEAAFLTVNLFARADILYLKNEQWHIIEVKKSSDVKSYQILDSAVQTNIIEKCGLLLASVSIMHINRNCEFPDLSNLFLTVDITNEVRSLIPQIEEKIVNFNSINKENNEPKVKLGPQCKNPFDCVFIKHCWNNIPEKSIFDLPALPGKKKWELFEAGKLKITDLDANLYKGNLKKAIEVTQANKLWIDASAVNKELKKWQWPLYFFDFESVGLAIPRYKSTKPYSAIPFQFSCHLWHKDKPELEHFEYLHTENSDPRPQLILAIVNNFLPNGSIVSYNKAFEISVIKQLADFAPEHAVQLLALIPRFVDPLPLFKNYVYHPDFLGSFSIKSVAPALIGDKLSYRDLVIGDGFAALASAELILNDKIHGKEKQTLIENLLAYCQQDTLAMVEIVKWLFANSKEPSL